MSSVLKKSVVLLSWLVLTGCSHPPVSDTLPVDPSVTPCRPLKALQRPPGFTLPPEDQRYQLPKKPLSNGEAPPVDNRPPIQPLALLPGSEAYYQGNQALLQLEKTTHTQALWQQLKQCLKQLAIATEKVNESQQILTTRWTDETDSSGARYQLSLSPKNTPPILRVQLLELRTMGYVKHQKAGSKKQDKKQYAWKKAIPDPGEQRHYAIVMLNRVATALDKQRAVLEPPTQRASAAETGDQSK